MRVAWFVCFAYAAWFGASLLSQQFTPRFRRLVQRLDVLRLCPTWHLFRSPPLHATLSWRDQVADRSVTEWQTAPMARPTSWLAPLWNPQAYPLHVQYLLVVELATGARDIRADRELEAGFAHRALTARTDRLGRPPQSVARQFRVLVCDDPVGGQAREVYCSELHRLPDIAEPA